MSTFYDELEFPRRAEYLDEYINYKVEITHWKDLCLHLGKQFRTVYQTRSAAVILVHGPMGSGKSLFCKRMLEDYNRTTGDLKKQIPPQNKPELQTNLWHALVAAADPTEEQIRETTQKSRVLQVSANDLRKLRESSPDQEIRVRVLLLDDAHKDPMVRPWTDMDVTEFYEARQRGPDALLARVAQDIDTACRGNMRRSVIVMCSNDRKWLEGLKGHLDQCFEGLAILVDMPVPQPQAVERIVRVNTNRLNKVSYWYCVDAAKPEKRREVRQTLTDRTKGFTNSFNAVSDSLAGDGRRRGPPRDRNVLTLVTLGAKCAAVQEFLEEREIEARTLHADTLQHVGVWEIWEAWASKMHKNLRAARMLESEFMFRWVNLDMVATHVLLQLPGTDDRGDRAWKLITRRPWVGEIDKLRPDVIVKQTVDNSEYGEYKPCELTMAAPKTETDKDIDKAIADAMLRTGHAVEFTAFLTDKLAHLDEYLRHKIETYVTMLESV